MNKLDKLKFEKKYQELRQDTDPLIKNYTKLLSEYKSRVNEIEQILKTLKR